MARFEPALAARLAVLWDGAPPNLYRALANHAAIVGAWSEFFATLRHRACTPRALRELVILRSAQLARSAYEWGQHLPMARRAGVREEQIAALARWRDAAVFDARERAALALAEAVHAGCVPEAVHAGVREHFDAAQYVELSVTAAAYAMVARVIEALRVEPDAVVREAAPPLAPAQ